MIVILDNYHTSMVILRNVTLVLVALVVIKRHSVMRMIRRVWRNF